MIEELIKQEIKRRQETIQLIAAENITRAEVLYPLSTVICCKTAEGTVGNRYHAGCSIVDKIEDYAESVAKKVLKSKQVWLQPHSGSTANMIVLFSLLSKKLEKPKTAKIFSMSLDQGGHLSHGSKYNISGKLFDVHPYFVDRETYTLNYDLIAKQASKLKPDIIICGASSYPRKIDFKKFGSIADETNSILISDIAHILGLIVAGCHPTPVPYSHFVTSSTYKAGGPRGGIVAAGEKSTAEQRKNITYSVFPGVQSTPNFASIASKALFFEECMTKHYKDTQKQIIKNAKALSIDLMKAGFSVLTNGTDNHQVILNVKQSRGITGQEAEQRLERCGLIVNKNLIPYDTESSIVSSGIRFGTHTVTRLGMKEKEMREISSLVDKILRSDVTKNDIKRAKEEVRELSANFSEIV